MIIVHCIYVPFLIFAQQCNMHSNSIIFHNSHYDIWALEVCILSCSQPLARHTNLCICHLVKFFTYQPSQKCQDCLNGFAVTVAELVQLHSCDDLIAHIYKLVSVELLLLHLATVKMLIIKSSCKIIFLKKKAIKSTNQSCFQALRI